MSTAPLPPNASLADIYAAIVPGQTIAEGAGENGAQKFVVLAVEHVYLDDSRERIRVYSISPTSGFLDIGACLAPPVDVLWQSNDPTHILWSNG